MESSITHEDSQIGISVCINVVIYFRNLSSLIILLIFCEDYFVMFRRQSYSDSSDNQKAFNFNYEIDIDKRKGGSTFNEEECVDFANFPDFRQDRSQKSYMTSQRKWLPSELMKRSEDDSSFQLMQNITEHSLKKKGGSVIDDIPPVIMEQSETKQLRSPKFVDLSQSYKTHSNIKGANEHFGAQSPTNILLNSERKQPNMVSSAKVHSTTPITPTNRINKQYKPSDGILAKMNALTKRQNLKTTGQWSLQKQYQNLIAKIQFYDNDSSLIDHQCFKIEEQITKLQQQLENPLYDIELKRYTDETNNINAQIAEQKNLQRSLNETHEKLEEQFSLLSASIQSLKFQRPSIVRDDARAIIDEISSLQRQFQSLKRDEGSLNLSSTLYQMKSGAVSVENRLGFQQCAKYKPEQALFQQFVLDIKQTDKVMRYPKYVYNIKMCIIKESWNIFENADVCVNISSRNYPKFQVKIGNKSIKDLDNFYLKDNANIIAENQKLFGKSFYTHSFTLNQISPPFTKLQLRYNSVLKPSQQQTIQLFIPTLPLLHGQFIPIYQKQFDIQNQIHADILEETKSQQYQQIDHQILKNRSIEQFKLYYPNLLYNQYKDQMGAQIKVLRGIFQPYNSTEGALVFIKQKRNLVSVTIKNNVLFLLNSLEFLLTCI